MRLHHVAFGAAAICAAFAWAAPMAWDRHAALVVVTLGLCVVGLALATGSLVLDALRPGRREQRYSQRQLDRAFRAGRDSGLGPTEATLARWRREGFGSPGVGR
jgi:hypothetical protein